MLRSSYKDRVEARMRLLGVTAAEMSEATCKPRSRLSEALNGEATPAAECLRRLVEKTLIGMVDSKRREIEAELEAAREEQFTEIEGRLSVIMPEDLIYIVTEDGVPCGVWMPEAKVFRELDDVILPVIRAKK